MNRNRKQNQTTPSPLPRGVHQKSSWNFGRSVLAGSVAILLAAVPVHASNIVWANTGTDFNAGASWTGGVAPINGDFADFTTALVKNPTLTASGTVSGLAISGGNYVIGGSSLTLTSVGTGGLNSSAIYFNNATINAPLVLGAAAGSTQTFTRSGPGATLTVNGSISSTNNIVLSLASGAINLNGANTYTAGGSATVGTYTYTYGTQVATGVTLGNKAALSTGGVQMLAASSISASTALTGANAVANNFYLNANLVTNGANSVEYSGNIYNNTVSGGITNNLTGGATLTLSGNIYVALGNAVTNGFAFGGVTTGATSATTYVTGNIANDPLGTSPAQPVYNLGMGLIVYSGNNTFTGSFNIGTSPGVVPGALLSGQSVNETTAELASANALSASVGNIILGSNGSNRHANAGVLGLGYSDLTPTFGGGANQVNINGNGGFAAYGTNRTVNANGGAGVTWASTTGFVKDGYALVLGSKTSDHTLDFQNAINLNGGLRTVAVQNGSAAVDGKLSGALTGATAGSGLLKNGLGTLQVTGANTYVGDTVITGGNLQVDSNLGSGAVRVGTAAVASFTGNTTLNSDTVTVTSAAGLYAGQLVTGSGIAAGTTIASVVGTTVYLSQAATATATGVTFAAAATVGTLSGSGQIQGTSVNVAAGSVIDPGSLGVVGKLTLNAGAQANYLTLKSGATLKFDLALGVTNDQINITNGVAGSVILNSNVINFNDLSGGALAFGDYILIDNATGVGGLFSGLTTDIDNKITGGLTIGTGLEAYNSANYSLKLVNDDVVLSVVPEPSTFGLALLGGIGMLGLRRRFRSGI